VQAEADDPEAQLQLDPNAWQHKWDNTQAGGDVCLYKLWLAGPPGPVKLIVRCAARGCMCRQAVTTMCTCEAVHHSSWSLLRLTTNTCV
jgi:hypothetical protein